MSNRAGTPIGDHVYDLEGNHKCVNGCGCWMGDTRSGGPDGIDPFGACPKAKPSRDLSKAFPTNKWVDDPRHRSEDGRRIYVDAPTPLEGLFPVGTVLKITHSYGHDFVYHGVVEAVYDDRLTVLMDDEVLLDCFRTETAPDHFECEDGRFLDFEIELPAGILAACPFCNSNDVREIHGQTIGKTTTPTYVHCENCGCNGPVSLTEDNVAAWNKRKEDIVS